MCIRDRSGQVTFTSSDSASITFLVGSLRNLVFASKEAASPINLGASFTYGPTGSTTTVTAPTLPITPVAGTLSKVTVSPVTANIAPGSTLVLKALGEYSTGVTQEITRHVTWSSADTTLVTVQTNSGTVNPLAGVAQASSTAETGKTVVITAANSNATAQTSATSTLTIQPAASP